VKFLFHVDDTLDLFAEHAIGGIIGLMFNSFFASSTIMAMDGVTTAVPDEWVKQLYKQFTYVCATSAYTFVFTALIAKTLDAIPGLSLRCTNEEEILGMDEVEVRQNVALYPKVSLTRQIQIGEFATDYIEIRRDVTDKPFFLEELKKKRKSFVVTAEMHELPKISSKHPTAEQQANHSPHQNDSKSDISFQNDPNQIQEVDIEKLSHYVVA
jgi:Amt family ammonium transporter